MTDAAAFHDLFALGSDRQIANLRARVGLIRADNSRVPVTFADAADRPNCYLCCPSTAYIDYGIDETRHFTRQPALRLALTGLLRAAAPLVRATGLDHQAQVNNWLLATNPPPPKGIVSAMQSLARQHPDRAILLRSVNDRLDAPLLAELRAAGGVLIPARQVWIWQPGQSPVPQNRKWDARLVADGRVAVEQGDSFSAADFDAAADLYGQLYLQKYTPLNPQYTPAFLRGMAQAGLMKLTGLRYGGVLVGVIGTVALGGMLTAPVVGYRTDLPQKLGLYRRLIALAMAEAAERDIAFNISAGAASFKRLRGAQPAIEYTAALVSHLPLKNRMATVALAGLLTRIGVPLLQRYAL